MSTKRYDPALKEKIIRLHLEQGRTIKSLTQEYHLGNGTLTYWLQEHRKECLTNPQKNQEDLNYQETLKLKKENEELRKENQFLKKAAAFFAKDLD